MADDGESVRSLANKLRAAVSLRVRTDEDMDVLYRGMVLDPGFTLSQARFEPLQRFDLRRKNGVSESRNTR
jgi:hypothetical protein